MTIYNENRKGYYKTKLGWIPEDWDYALIKDCLIIENNNRTPINKEERKLIKGNFPYYGPTKIQDYINCYKYDGTYALIAEDGDHFLKYRDLSMTQLVSGKFNVNNHAHIIKGTKRCSTEWFYWYYNRKCIYSHITRQGAGRYKLNKASLQQLPITIPPLKEQKKIVTILSTWDKAIEHTQTLVDKLKVRKKGLMQQLLTGKTRLPGFSENWNEDKLGIYFYERKETKQINLPLLSVGKAGVYPQDDVDKKDTSNSDKSKYKKICIGDIGYNTMRMWQGRSALSDIEGIVSPAYTIVCPKQNADSAFFSYLFKLEEIIHKFFRNSQGMVSDTWMCKFKDFSIVKFKAPSSLKEQTQIAKVLTEADNEINQQQAYLDELKKQKKGLMQQLLTGQTRVTIN